jgi:hypothetical protein
VNKRSVLFAGAGLCAIVLASIVLRTPVTAEFIRYETNNSVLIRFVNRNNYDIVCNWNMTHLGLQPGEGPSMAAFVIRRGERREIAFFPSLYLLPSLSPACEWKWHYVPQRDPLGIRVRRIIYRITRRASVDAVNFAVYLPARVGGDTNGTRLRTPAQAE